MPTLAIGSNPARPGAGTGIVSGSYTAVTFAIPAGLTITSAVWSVTGSYAGTSHTGTIRFGTPGTETNTVDGPGHTANDAVSDEQTALSSNQLADVNAAAGGTLSMGVKTTLSGNQFIFTALVNMSQDVAAFSLILTYSWTPILAKLALAQYQVTDASSGATLAGYTDEILKAQRIGIDGFIVDVPAWINSGSVGNKTKMTTLYQAANALGTGFKLAWSVDKLGISAITPADIIDMVTTFGHDPHYLTNPNNGLPILFTFSGAAYGQTNWQTNVLTPLANAGYPVSFIPNWIFGAATAATMPNMATVYSSWLSIIDGALNFASSTYATRLAQLNSIFAAYFHSQSPQKLAIGGCVPAYWDQHDAAKEYTENLGDWGFFTQFQQLIATCDWMDIATWNDYTEATYIYPDIATAAANLPARATNNRFNNHQGYYDVLAYYIEWFKTGIQPKIWRDWLFYSYRMQSDTATNGPTPDPVTTPQGAPDNIYVTVFLTQPATLSVVFDNGTTTNFSQSCSAGITRIAVPFGLDTKFHTPGQTGTPTLTLTRDAAGVASAGSVLFKFTGPTVYGNIPDYPTANYDFNPTCGMSMKSQRNVKLAQGIQPSIAIQSA